MPIGYQIIFRAEDEQVLAPTPAKRRLLAEILLDAGRERGLFAFGVADTHGHADLLGGMDIVGQFIHDLRVSVGWTLGVKLRKPEVWKIRDVWHAGNLIDYAHRQTEHHGVDIDPFRECTSLPDLMGLRVTAPWLAERVASHVPRYEGPIRPLSWGEDPFERVIRLAVVADAAAAAFNLPDLRGRSERVVEARKAAVHATASFEVKQVASALGVSKRTIYGLRSREADLAAVQCVLRQAALRSVQPRAVGAMIVRDSGAMNWDN